MQALAALDAASDVDALRAGLDAAKAVPAGVLPALDEEVSVAHAKLEDLQISAGILTDR